MIGYRITIWLPKMDPRKEEAASLGKALEYLDRLFNPDGWGEPWPQPLKIEIERMEKTP